MQINNGPDGGGQREVLAAEVAGRNKENQAFTVTEKEGCSGSTLVGNGYGWSGKKVTGPVSKQGGERTATLRAQKASECESGSRGQVQKEMKAITGTKRLAKSGKNCGRNRKGNS